MSDYRSLVFLALVSVASAVNAETETITSQGIGMDTQLVFTHAAVPGANAIAFNYSAGFAPVYPAEETHAVVIDFEWGPSATGPWSRSPDNVNTVPGGKTDFYATGVYTAPVDARFVALHFYAGGLMVTSGTFEHLATTVPLPGPAWLLALGLAVLRGRRRHSV